MAKLQLPEKLRRAPIVEAVFELRFQPAKESVADLLVGMFYSNQKLQSYQQRVRALPGANVPRQFRESDPNLKYLASHQLSGDGSHLVIGDRVIGVSKTKYHGWSELKDSAKIVLEVAQQTKLIGAVERYSLKAVNILPVEGGSALEKLNGRFEIAGRQATDRGFHFRTEFVSNELATIVEIATNASVTVDGQLKSGMLVTLDTLRAEGAEQIWRDPEACLERVHIELKSLFFDLLTPATIQSLEPIWGSNGLSS